MITYILQVLIFQVLFLAVYDFFLSKETFHKYNRWYLLGTPIVSFVLPLIKIPTLQKAVPEEIMIFLPEIVLSPQKVIEQTTFYTENSVNYISILFWSGVLLFSLIFLIKLFKIGQLIRQNETINKAFYKLVLLPKQTIAFSFFNFIFLGKEISQEKQAAIIEHELIHSKQKHSLDLLFFEFLRIVMWFNPMIYFYQQRITLLHEYISDAEVVKTTEKHDYFNNLLSQTFQVENISFVNQFYKHSLIKKRITMMTKNKSKQIKKAKYLVLLPLLASMLVYTSCNQENSKIDENQEIERLRQTVIDLEKENKMQNDTINFLKKSSDYLKKKLFSEHRVDVPFTIIEEVPIFPGCSGTREEKLKCLNEKIQSVVVENFNAELSKNLGLKKGEKRVTVFFRINEEGEVVDIKARAPHAELKKEALRVASLLPKMKPGRQRGKAVGMKYTLPISFKVE